MLTIGRLAQRTGISRDAVRFYERSGLLKPPSRTEAGYRLYDETDVQRVALIKQAQLCGLRLETIRELLRPVDGARARSCRAYRTALAQRGEVEHRLEALRSLHEQLLEFIGRCERADAGASIDILARAKAAVPETVPWPALPMRTTTPKIMEKEGI